MSHRPLSTTYWQSLSIHTSAEGAEDVLGARDVLGVVEGSGDTVGVGIQLLEDENMTVIMSVKILLNYPLKR